MKVSELEGAELDYWVAKAEGVPYKEIFVTNHRTMSRAETTRDFTSDWKLGGPIIEREKIAIEYTPPNEYGWVATLPNEVKDTPYGKGKSYFIHSGPTPLIAAMRCFVVSKFGEEVDQ